MKNDAVVVVGDRFDDFLANDGTISMSELMERVHADDAPRGLPILVGQGLAEGQLEALERLVQGGRLSVGGPLPAYVARDLTHKRDPKNVLIGLPEPLADGRFVADLLIDGSTETMEDHLTGQHVPAIVLTEAARQMWTVVTERYLLDHNGMSIRFVINDVQSAFRALVFPLPATVEYELIGREANPVQQVFTCRVTVHQGGAVAAEVQASYRVIPERFSDKQERMAAKQAVAQHLAEVDELATGGSPAKAA